MFIVTLIEFSRFFLMPIWWHFGVLRVSRCDPSYLKNLENSIRVAINIFFRKITVSMQKKKNYYIIQTNKEKTSFGWHFGACRVLRCDPLPTYFSRYWLGTISGCFHWKNMIEIFIFEANISKQGKNDFRWHFCVYRVSRCDPLSKIFSRLVPNAY